MPERRSMRRCDGAVRRVRRHRRRGATCVRRPSSGPGLDRPERCADRVESATPSQRPTSSGERRRSRHSPPKHRNSSSSRRLDETASSVGRCRCSRCLRWSPARARQLLRLNLPRPIRRLRPRRPHPQPLSLTYKTPTVGADVECNRNRIARRVRPSISHGAP